MLAIRRGALLGPRELANRMRDTFPGSQERVAAGDIFDLAIMAGPVGDVLASGQVVINNVETLSGLQLSVTVRSGAGNRIFPPSTRSRRCCSTPRPSPMSIQRAAP